MSTRLASRFNFREVESEWRWEFVFYVLSNMGVPDDMLSECLPEDSSFKDIDVNHQIRLRKHMDTFDISIIDDRDGGTKIYVYTDEQHVLIAEWKKCIFVYKEDWGEVDPAHKVYVEVLSDTWTIFDEGAKQAGEDYE